MSRVLAVLLAFCFYNVPAIHASPAPASLIAQDQPPQDQPQDQPQYQQQDQGPAYENFSPEQLDNLLSPIALYPDPLLAQLFVAATFPDQVEEAARYVRANGPNGVDDQYWDVSVRAIAHYPAVVEMMADKIDWTTSLGQAYVNQSTDVAASVQHLRHMARDVGNLASSQQEEVIEHDNYIAITPYQPEYIYVPVYDPAICYYRRPYWGPAITFGVGFPIGAWLNLDFRWGFGGGWGGVYYTGWRREGWGGRGDDCWNCGWIGRSRGRVDINNNVYINNRYNNITVNRNVVNRTVNVNNINRYNAVHKNVNYNNVEVNNSRANRVNNGNNGRPGNAQGNSGNFANNGRSGGGQGNAGNNGRPGGAQGNIGNNGNNGRPGGAQANTGNNGNNGRSGGAQGNSGNFGNSGRPGGGQGNTGNYGNNGRTGYSPGGNDRPGANNKIIDRNINRSNPQIDQYRGRDNNIPNSANSPQRPMPGPAQRMQNPPNTPQPQYRQQGQQAQGRQAPQSQMTRPTPHTFSPNEGNFDPRAASQRGQASRQQPAPQRAAPPPQQRSAPPPRAQNNPAPAQRGGGGRKP
jgi:hypothetical protein